MLREGPAVLMVSGVKDSTIPPWVTSTGIEVNMLMLYDFVSS